MATVTFQNATRVYPGSDHPAVDDFNLEIADGEFLVLVGPSGCGKSTTLRMLAGLEDVNSGRIFIGDRDVTDVQPKNRDIAMVFQNYALYPHMTVRDNMGFALKIAGEPKDEIRKRVDEAAKILDLTPYLERKPKALSGGQRQRVAMGRAIVRKPQVFLMDEPLSNLDAKLRVQTRTQIASLQRQLGVTTVYDEPPPRALYRGGPGRCRSLGGVRPAAGATAWRRRRLCRTSAARQGPAARRGVRADALEQPLQRCGPGRPSARRPPRSALRPARGQAGRRGADHQGEAVQIG